MNVWRTSPQKFVLSRLRVIRTKRVNDNPEAQVMPQSVLTPPQPGHSRDG
jgi:hypothetical protein